MTTLEHRLSFLVAVFAMAKGRLYGGARSGPDADREQQKAFKRCLSGRGYRVLN